MKVFIILTLAVLISFILSAIYTGSLVASYATAFAVLFCVASIIWRIDFGTWNPFK